MNLLGNAAGKNTTTISSHASFWEQKKNFKKNHHFFLPGGAPGHDDVVLRPRRLEDGDPVGAGGGKVGAEHEGGRWFFLKKKYIFCLFFKGKC